MNTLKLLHNLFKNYKPYKIISDVVEINGERKFVATIYHNDEIILRADYWVLGSYSNDKNLWIWGDQSNVLEKNMCKKICLLRECMGKNVKNNETFLAFLNNNYSVIATSDFYDKLSLLKSLLIDFSCDQVINKNKNRDIITTMGRKVMHVFVLERILSDNMKDF